MIRRRPAFLRLTLSDGEVGAGVGLVRTLVELDVARPLQRNGQADEGVPVDLKRPVRVTGVDHDRRGGAEVAREGLQVLEIGRGLVARAADVWECTGRGDGQEEGKDCCGLHGGLDWIGSVFLGETFLC